MSGLDALWSFLAADPVGLTSRYLLIGVFVAAGLTKVRHPLVAATALVSFRLVSRADRRLGLGLGLFELAVAAGLTGVAGESIGRTATGLALGACVAYVVVVARALREGDVEACTCFSTHGTPLDGWTIVRNLGLVVAALSAWLTWPTSAAGMATQLRSLLLAVLLVGVAVALRVVRTNITTWARLRERVDWDQLRMAAKERA